MFSIEFLKFRILGILNFHPCKGLQEEKKFFWPISAGRVTE